MTRLSYIIVALSVVLSCRRTPSAQKQDNTGVDSLNNVKQKITFVSPVADHIYKIDREISLKVTPVDTIVAPDSIQFLVNGEWKGSVKSFSDQLTWNTENASAGTAYISARVFKDSAINVQNNITIKLYPANPAVVYTYNVVNTYPHSITYYTQGLVFEQGRLFEGTGLYEESALREIKMQTGEVLKEYTLPREVFGEGIAICGNRIIQITWKEQVAFIYDKSSFRLINKINYPLKEGWGITFDGTHLILSDGSSILYFLNKDDLTEYKRVEVCDEKGPVIRLNELEYINGEIWANVYTTDTIVRIQPNTGIVTGKIDMTGLLKPLDRKPDTNVLNGIAFDPQTGRVWVTGKNWPKLFQVAIKPKQR